MKDIHIIIPPKAVSKIYTGSVVVGSILLFASLSFATTPNPGHLWTDVGNGNWQVANTQLATRTFTFPDANTSISGTLGSVLSGTIPYGNGTPVLATTSAGTSGFVLAYLNGIPTWQATTTLSTISIPSSLTLARGGTGVGLSAVNGGVTYSNASTLANSAAGSVGQILQSAGAATPTWSTATYPVTAGASGNVLRSDGTNWTSLTPPGSFIGTQVFTASGTYTATVGTNSATLVLVGSGGGGGGVTGVASSVGAAGGGGSGGVGIVRIGGGLCPLSCITSATITINAAGTAGTTAGGNGGLGGNTQVDWGTHTYIANGGSGGTGQVAGTTLARVLGGAGGTVSTALVNGAGHPGALGYRASGTFGWSGNGGSTPYGGGGLGRTTAGAGVNGTGFGGGGGGALSTAAVAQAGGTGGGGLVIIYEYR